MALGGVFITDVDGNIINNTGVSTEKVSGLLFDVSKQSDVWTTTIGAKLKSKLNGTVVELNSMEDVKELGITPYSGDTDNDFIFGVPYYHINTYFSIVGGSGKLFVMFADCSKNFDAVQQMQRAANGQIFQLGVWTEQSLFKQTDEMAATYTVQLVNELNNQALALAKDHAPLSIFLSAQPGRVDTSNTAKTTIDLNKIPSLLELNCNKVTVLLSQCLDEEIHKMQLANETNLTPVGVVGLALGFTSVAAVCESYAWVNKFNAIGYVSDIEMGFGDISIDGSSHDIKSTLKYSSLSTPQLDTLEDKGFVFLCKYPGYNGIFFSNDRTCSNGDYRTVARNRTIHKSRLGVRKALLPYVNSPIKVDPSTGYMSSATITVFRNLVTNVLSQMVANEEISGYSVTISATQNVLTDDKILISYKIVPVGSAHEIDVTEGLALTIK